MDANLRSMFLVCRAAVGRMLAQPHDVHGLRGTVLNMASVIGKHPQRDFFGTHAYAASKGAILSLSRAMAATYAPEGIRVNAIAPGLVRTPMSRRAQDDPAILAAIGRRFRDTASLGIAAALFGFVVSFGNLEMSLFLVGVGRTTLPIAILQYLEWKIDPTIAAISTLLVALSVALLAASQFASRGERR